MKAVLIFLSLIAVLFLISCTTVDSTAITDLQRDPASYSGQDIAVVGRVSKEIAGEGDSSRFTYYVKDYSGQKIRLGCGTYDLIHNQKYIIYGKFVYNNQTLDYFIRCTDAPKKTGSLY